ERAQAGPAYGLLDAYCAPASTAWLTRICCEKARPRSITGVNMARKTGAASPNSTADMPLRSRASAPIRAPIRARLGRKAAATQPEGGPLYEDMIHGRQNITRPPRVGARQEARRVIID